ncbi:hypothetical protein CP533_1159 [Ophiocordyceps camponoti-saundersi (nom. inval.)]|nr:hypothetical protein CP533_1159 [Ophiocordyceps camponoti-saundersi (nom. inval.)]
MSNLYGLGCDNVAEHEVVLANGTLIKANATRNADLHWALKGGGNNFAIVTSFKLYTYPIGRVWGGIRLYGLDQLPALYTAMAEYQSQAVQDSHASVMLQAFPTNHTLGAVLTVVYLKAEAWPSVLAPFSRIPFTTDATKIRSYLDLLANTNIPTLPRYDWRASTVKPDGRLYASIHNMTSSSSSTLEPLSRLTSGTLAVGLQPMSRSGVLAGRRRGGNALGLSPEAQTWLVLAGAWYFPSDDGPAHEAIRELGGRVGTEAAGLGLGLSYLFMNDASFDQPVIASYGAENVARLRDVQRVYDPDQEAERQLSDLHQPSNPPCPTTMAPKSRRETDSLATQYGGHHSGVWVSHLPSSWIPLVQLSRLSPPVGLALIYLPHLFGALLAAIQQGTPARDLLRACAVLFIGSFFFSNAAHGWNDVVDAPLDRLVARTRTRPIPRGALSVRAAVCFVFSQAVGAAAVLFLLMPVHAAPCTLPSIVATCYYPWAKRHTHMAQLVLGFCLSWGVVVGFESLSESSMGVPTFCLVAACILWTAVYDTIYAHQDADDDARLGLKSMALLFRGHTKAVLWLFVLLVAGLLVGVGLAASMAWPYFLITPLGSALSLGVMVARVELGDPFSCWWWFRYGFWLAGSSIAVGLSSEYALSLTF